MGRVLESALSGSVGRLVVRVLPTILWLLVAAGGTASGLAANASDWVESGLEIPCHGFVTQGWDAAQGRGISRRKETEE